MDNPVFEICGVRIDLGGCNQPYNIRITHTVPKAFEKFALQDKNLAVIIGEKTINVHRALLNARIPYFKALFDSNMSDSSSGEINLSSNLCEFDFETVECLLEYSYTGRITISEGNVQDLMMGAVYLQIESIIHECARFMTRRLRFDNAIPVLFFFRAVGYYEFEDYIYRFMDKNFVPISFTSEFLEQSIEDLVLFIQRDSLNVDSEEQVFDAVSRWIAKDIENRKQYAPRLLKCVRCARFSESFVTDVLEESGWVMESPECIALVNDAKQYIHYESGNITSLKTSARVCAEARNLIFALVERFSPTYSWTGRPITNFLGTTLELYDPVMDTWTEVGVGQMDIAPKYTEAQITVVNNKIYFLKKPGPECDTCDVFDMVANEWSKFPNMLSTRHRMMTAVIDGKIYVAGGFDESIHDGLSSMEFCDPAAKYPEWLPLASMSKRREVAASCVLDGKLYVFGGREGTTMCNDGEYYNPETDKWIPISPMKTRKWAFSAAALNGKIYVAGGKDENWITLGDVERYDPITDTWTTLRSLNTARYYVVLAVSCGKLFALGGFDDDSNYSCVEMYHPETDTWEDRAPMSKKSMSDQFFIGVCTIPAAFPSPLAMLQAPSIHGNGFAKFHLKEEILRAIADCRFDHPSEAQAEWIPLALLPNNLVCQAISGTGKTTAFVIATLQQLKPIKRQVSVLVICRSSQVAAQIGREYERLSAYLDNVKTGVFTEEIESKQLLKKNYRYRNPHIVTGTPEKLLSLVKSRALKIHQVSTLVIDDCDEIIRDATISNQVLEIVKSTPPQKKVIMFSSNVDPKFSKRCEKFIKKFETASEQRSYFDLIFVIVVVFLFTLQRSIAKPMPY